MFGEELRTHKSVRPAFNEASHTGQLKCTARNRRSPGNVVYHNMLARGWQDGDAEHRDPSDPEKKIVTQTGAIFRQEVRLICKIIKIL